MSKFFRKHYDVLGSVVTFASKYFSRFMQLYNCKEHLWETYTSMVIIFQKINFWKKPQHSISWHHCIKKGQILRIHYVHM